MESRSKTIFGLIIVLEICSIITLSILTYKNYKDNQNLVSKIEVEKEIINNIYIDNNIDKELSFYQNIEEEINQLKEEYYDNIALLENKINKGETNAKIAYLTFDDGPYELTWSYLDVLRKNDIRATFFVIGKNGRDDIYRAIANDGHVLGNHTYYHNISTGLYSSTANFINQVKKLEEHVYNVTGQKTTIVRFPGGSSQASYLKDDIINNLHAIGYNYVDWTSETGDGTNKKLAMKSIWNWYVDSTRDQNIIVLLMHDYSEGSLSELQRIIDDLKNRGFIFLPLTNKSIMTK